MTVEVKYMIKIVYNNSCLETDYFDNREEALSFIKKFKPCDAFIRFDIYKVHLDEGDQVLARFWEGKYE